MDYEVARAALERIGPDLEDDEAEALTEIVELFAPYGGDDPAEAKARQGKVGHCGNCGREAEIMFAPAPLPRVATTAIRLAQCPRCHSTNMRVGPAPATS